ncbi:MAG: hypothetical protein ACYDD1_16005 [Caulobacteraceae bacterium]
MSVLTQRAIQQAVRGAMKGGMDIGRVEIDPRTGRIVILPAGEGAVQGDDLDDELRAWRSQNGEGRP